MIRQAATIAIPRLRAAAVLQNNRHATKAVLQQFIVTRTLVDKAPGVDPLEVLRRDCLARKLCDQGGYRNAGVHWVFAVAMASPDNNNNSNNNSNNSAPNLRTVGIQKVSPAGIDFVMKKAGLGNIIGTMSDDTTDTEQPVSFLYSQGKYKAGNTAEQWRGDGLLEKIPLSDILHCLPHYTVTGMLVSKRMEKERQEQDQQAADDSVSVDRLALLNKSHVTEMTQRTRLELENEQVSQEELEESIQAYRFSPNRLERMHGGPDSIMWERWEWLRSASGDCPEGAIPWNIPKHLLPY